MPKQKVMKYQAILFLDVEKMEKVLGDIKAGGVLIAQAFASLADAGIFLEDIKEVTNDTASVNTSETCPLCKKDFKEGERVTYLTELRMSDGSEVSGQEKADLLNKILHRSCLLKYFNERGGINLYGIK